MAKPRPVPPNCRLVDVPACEKALKIMSRLRCSMLERFGFEVELACDGEEAVRAVETSNPALILMDARMPGLDGVEAARRIRALVGPDGDHARRVPIIALSASAAPEGRGRYLSAGMDDLLAKPFTEAELRAVIDRWMGAKRL